MYFSKCIFAKCTRLACLLSFASLFLTHPLVSFSGRGVKISKKQDSVLDYLPSICHLIVYLSSIYVILSLKSNFLDYSSDGVLSQRGVRAHINADTVPSKAEKLLKSNELHFGTLGYWKKCIICLSSSLPEALYVIHCIGKG